MLLFIKGEEIRIYEVKKKKETEIFISLFSPVVA